jgi:hypothetical protein
MRISKTKLKQIIKEELQVVLTNEEVEEMFGEEVREQVEAIEEEEKNNPWAICTASVGRENKEKYEKCVMSVKRSKNK